MSASFTPVVSSGGGTDLQSVSFLNELVVGYGERQQALGTSPTFLPLAAGDDVQGYVKWASIQGGMQTISPNYVDYTAPIAGASAVPTYTLSSFRTAAGIPSGYRRATSWPTDWTNYSDPAFSYGLVENGDILGPWVFVDLQKAMSALRWTYRGTSTGDVPDRMTKTEGTVSVSTDYSAALAEHAAEWAVAVPSSGGGDIYSASVSVYRQPGGNFYFYSRREYGTPQITGMPTFRPSSCDVYIQPYSYYGPGVFYDIDGLGTQYMEMFYVQSVAESSAPTRTGTQYGNIATCPAVACGLQEYQIPPYPDSAELDNVQNDLAVHWIVKWNFTNSNP